MLKKISIVIVNWNSNKLVKEQVDLYSELVSKVIVVDNASDSPLKFNTKKKCYYY